MKTVTLLIKPASSLCNLCCRYCFYEEEARNRSLCSPGVMSDALVETLLRKVFDAVDPHGLVSFAFQGGEPSLAGLPFFQRFTGLVKAFRPAGVRVQFSIQTNGTLLTGEWAGFFRAEGFLVGLSLDGFRDNHEANRVDAQGNSTWKKVLHAKKLLEQYGVPYNILCVVTGPCARHPDLAYSSLKKLGVSFLQFIACLDPLDQPRGSQPWSLSPDGYGNFLCRVFDLWYQDWSAGSYHSVRLFEDYVHILLGDSASTCATCGRCGAYLVIEGDGSVYPCDFFALDPWRMGSIQENTLAQLADSAASRAFLRQSAAKPAECASCPYGKLCRGGCPRDWFYDEAGPHNFYCASFKMLLDHGLPRMAAIANAEAAARGR